MNDLLWETASRDVEAEDLERRVTAARVAAAHLWPFLAAANSQTEYGDRKALIADRIEHVAANAAGNDPVLFGVVHSTLVSRFDEDFGLLHSARLAALRKAAEGQTCAVCGDPIAKDPSGEEPSTWHHDNGEKHDHEAKPASGDSKESSRKVANDDKTFQPGDKVQVRRQGPVLTVKTVTPRAEGEHTDGTPLGDMRAFDMLTFEESDAPQNISAGWVSKVSSRPQTFTANSAAMTTTITWTDVPFGVITTAMGRRTAGIGPVGISQEATGDPSRPWVVRQGETFIGAYASEDEARVAAEAQGYRVISSRKRADYSVVDMALEGDPAAKVTKTVPAAEVLPGYWDADADSGYAVLMDHESDGTQRWHRASFWAPFGHENGWDRVARIASRRTAEINAAGWPRVPSPMFPGETIPSCPKCGSTHVVMEVLPGYGGRIGDPGTESVRRCQDCGYRESEPANYSVMQTSTGSRRTAGENPFPPKKDDAEGDSQEAQEQATWTCPACGATDAYTQGGKDLQEALDASEPIKCGACGNIDNSGGQGDGGTPPQQTPPTPPQPTASRRKVAYEPGRDIPGPVNVLDLRPGDFVTRGEGVVEGVAVMAVEDTWDGSSSGTWGDKSVRVSFADGRSVRVTPATSYYVQMSRAARKTAAAGQAWGSRRIAERLPNGQFRCEQEGALFGDVNDYYRHLDEHTDAWERAQFRGVPASEADYDVHHDASRVEGRDGKRASRSRRPFGREASSDDFYTYNDGGRSSHFPLSDADFQRIQERDPDGKESEPTQADYDAFEQWIVSTFGPTARDLYYGYTARRRAVRHTAPGGGAHPPYEVEERDGKWVVVNSLGEVKGTHETKEQAREQQKALYANTRESARKTAEVQTRKARDLKPGDRASFSIHDGFHLVRGVIPFNIDSADGPDVVLDVEGWSKPMPTFGGADVRVYLGSDPMFGPTLSARRTARRRQAANGDAALWARNDRARQLLDELMERRRQDPETDLRVRDERARQGLDEILEQMRREFDGRAGSRRQAANPYQPTQNPYIAEPPVSPGMPDDALDGPMDNPLTKVEPPRTTRPRQKPNGAPADNSVAPPPQEQAVTQGFASKSMPHLVQER